MAAHLVEKNFKRMLLVHDQNYEERFLISSRDYLFLGKLIFKKSLQSAVESLECVEKMSHKLSELARRRFRETYISATRGNISPRKSRFLGNIAYPSELRVPLKQLRMHLEKLGDTANIWSHWEMLQVIKICIR